MKEKYQITHEDEKELAGKEVQWKCGKGKVFDAFIVVSRTSNACSIKPLDPEAVQDSLDKGEIHKWGYAPSSPKFCFWTISAASWDMVYEIGVLVNARRGQVLTVDNLVPDMTKGCYGSGCAI